MSQPILHLILAGLLGGAVGGGAVGLMMKQPSTPSKATASAEPSAPSEEEEVSDEPGGDQDDRVRTLEREVAKLKRKSAAAQALAQYAKGISAEEDGGGAATPFIHPEDPVFELSVRSVLDKVDQERRDERQQRRTARAQERVKRQTELLTERLKLTPDQVAKVEKILMDRVEHFRALRNQDGGARPVTRREWREQARIVQKKTDEQLAEVLDETQMKGYQAFQEEEGFGRGRGRGRGR